MSSRLRKQFLSIAESPLKRVEDEVLSIAKLVADNSEDEEVKNSFFDLVIQLVVEQPFKIPFVAAVVLVVNTLKSELVKEVLGRAVMRVNAAVEGGEWREVKLLMKFLGGLQGIFDGEGVWIPIQDILERAVELQTDNNEEVCVCDLAVGYIADYDCRQLVLS